MNGIDTLVFDLDGTLTDNYAGISACITHALVTLGAAVPDEARLRECVGPPLRASFREFLRTDEPAHIEQAIVHYRERFDVHGWKENVPYAGIEAALQRLAAGGFRMLVCTSKPQRYADRIVEHFGLRTFFEGVHGPDLAGALDDKRALLAHTIAKRGIDPSRAMMIGDRAQDMRAAGANGVRGLGVLYGYGSRDELLDAGAAALCESVDALPAAVVACAGLKMRESS
jgi:phosphoglycolate phosphatase